MTDHLVRSDGSDTPEDNDTAWTRRGFLLGAASLALVAITVDPAVAAAELPDFPADVTPYRSGYRNWVGEITADGLWACAPAAPARWSTSSTGPGGTAGRSAPGAPRTAGHP